MPRNNIPKDELKAKIYKLKTSLFENRKEHSVPTAQSWYDGAHESLNDVLNILDEYRY
jgi:hypothetical protein